LAEQEIALVLTEEAKSELARQGYDPEFGARPLKRAIQKHLQDPLAMKLLAGEFKPGDRIEADAQGDKLVFRKLPGDATRKSEAA
jgi:ATP-dependent Clp protease ATP-binding subunit ClpB